MKLPWNTEDKEQKIEQLQEKLEQLEQEKQSVQSQLEAEKERRKKHSREKQEAEEELNRLQDRLRNLEEDEVEEVEQEKNSLEFSNLSFSNFRKLLDKLASIESSERELVTVYAPEGISEVEKELKNSVDSETFARLSKLDSFAAFIDEQLGTFILRFNAELDAKVEVGTSFNLEPLQDFVETEKVFATVSAGETKIYREESGEYELLERVSSRVDHEHSSGGFSQGRFERKREEQVEGHLEQVEEALEEYGESKVYLLGEKRLCKELPGTRLTGFDQNTAPLLQLYSPRLARI